MQIVNAAMLEKVPHTYLIYGKPGIGKTSTMRYAGGNILHLDVDRLSGVLRDAPNAENIDIAFIDNINTFDEWNKSVVEITQKTDKQYDYIVIDNLSELERCVLSDLGRVGKNQGVPAQGDYQKMQFKIVDSIRFLKKTGANIVIMCWEQYETYIDSSGQTYTMAQPQINKKIMNNISGLCDCVGRLTIKSDGERGFVLQPTNSVFAKNQIDTRKGCKQEEFFNHVSVEALPTEAS